MSEFKIHPEAYVGAVHLIVSNLDRALRFYGDVLGFKRIRSEDGTLALAADGTTPVILLTEIQEAQLKPPHTTGLYHYAIRVPERVDLAQTLVRLSEKKYPLQGAADHGVSEALYLADPDGNGIEIYADRPRNEWSRVNGQVQMGTDPLDVDGLLAELGRDGRPWNGMSPQTRIGHVHLHVADLRRTETFYHDVLGLDLMLRYSGSALFFSAGGYHHHIGVNTWAGAGAPPPPPDAVGLRYFIVTLPDEVELQRVAEHLEASAVDFDEEASAISLRDPSGNGIRLMVGSATGVVEDTVMEMSAER